MPWSIVKGGGTCPVDQYAVIKTSDGSTAGCHPTPDKAKRQLAALYVNEKKRSVLMRRNTLALAGEPERRGLPAEVAVPEIRSMTEGDGPATDRFVGYAAKWNERTAIGDLRTVGFYEECAPGMVTKTLREGDQRFLIDHNPYYVVSRVSAGTLNLRSDDVGLPVDSALDPDLYYVKALKANVRNRNITGMSFGMRVIKDEWRKEQVRSADGASTTDAEVRTLLEVQLVEVSAVTFPAYTKTQAELKSVASAMRSRVELHGDTEAIERRAEFWPELPELCGIDRDLRPTIIDLGHLSEPVAATRTQQKSDESVEPAASTQLRGPSVAERMRVMSTRWHLPVG